MRVQALTQETLEAQYLFLSQMNTTVCKTDMFFVFTELVALYNALQRAIPLTQLTATISAQTNSLIQSTRIQSPVSPRMEIAQIMPWEKDQELGAISISHMEDKSVPLWLELNVELQASSW